jgi:2,3-dimethylmalate lyase
VTSKGTILRRAIERDGIVMAPGVYDAYCARMVQQAGFSALSVTGNAVSAALLGRPDVGLLTLTEMVDNSRRIANAVEIPVIADADTGYGGVTNVIRTVQEFEAAGVAAIHLEDQETPKRCGHMAGPRRVIPMEEMLGKLEAALWARTNPDFVIIGRTDAAKAEGLDGAIRRAKAYADLGVDMVSVHTTEGEEALKRIADAINKPLTVNMDEAGKAWLVSLEELGSMGFRIASYPGTVRYSVAWAVQQALVELRTTRATNGLRDRMVSFEEYNSILGLEDIKALSDRFTRDRG